MEDYKLRMIKEYTELKERFTKLRIMLKKWDEGTLDFTPSCPRKVLDQQFRVMYEYLLVLQLRAALEDVELPE